MTVVFWTAGAVAGCALLFVAVDWLLARLERWERDRLLRGGE